ncbi:hypothetical protein Daus18300_011988 [Diaporthe australafricana]|uniref:Uncharacterized protein n=1 Tax=Diaporthe australafricana TaxID=127596 RepID=A0ABR3W4L3_9PEZI
MNLLDDPEPREPRPMDEVDDRGPEEVVERDWLLAGYDLDLLPYALQSLQGLHGIIVVRPKPGYDFARAAVDVGHASNLMPSLLHIILIDAQRVDPYDPSFVS